ncbi:phosphoethanolamine transferase [Helicobacter felis]|uniref:phosphoethanolamine transferase n=1 Tax=Helicobacter felis TaxID=214 RepID=UPI001F095419|nr:phosphoethanolamine transferase [Helicobacter felis]
MRFVGMVLDRRFWLMWLAPIVASFFSVDVQVWEEMFWHVLKVAFYSLLVFYVFYFLVEWLRFPKLAQFLKNTMLILSLGLNFIDFFASCYFHMGFTPSLVGTLLATNIRESREFLQSMVFPHMGFVLGYLAACAGFLYLVRFELILSIKQSLQTFLVLFVAFWAHNIGAFYLQKRHSFLINPNIPTRVIPVVKEIYAIVFHLKEYAQSKEIYSSLKKPYPKDYVHVDADSVSNVVLIVGESASRNFMGVYGYGVPNTPFLSALARDDAQNLFVFRDVISAFANTYSTFKTLLNYGDVENSATPWFLQKKLGRIFNLAGYQTFWIDAQDDLENNRSFALWSYPFTHRIWGNGPLDVPNATLDEWLVEAFNQRAKSKLASKNFILFHLFGSHATYTSRFPKDFAKFTPAQIPYRGLHVKNEQDKQIVADYVNSLYYTDHVLEEIFKLFKDKDAVIVYLSDHAQDIFESSDTYGHRCSDYGVEIPFVIYVSDLFKQKHPQKVQQLAQALNKPFMSDDLIHTLLSLAGIHTRDNLESKNLLSAKFDIGRKRVYCGNHVLKTQSPTAP